MSLPVQQGAGLRHGALFYADDGALLETAVRFASDSIDRGEMVLVTTGPGVVSTVLGELFAGEERLVVPDVTFYDTPASAVEQYRRVMAEGVAAGVPGFSAVGRIDFEASPLPWTEWVRYEAVVNRVFADHPFNTLCLYDVRVDSTPLLEAMHRTHPVRDFTAVAGEPQYPRPGYSTWLDVFSDERYRSPADPVEVLAPQLEALDVGSLEEVRLELASRALHSGLSRRAVDDFVVAAGQVVDNAVAHGSGSVRLRLWAVEDRLVATVTDRGPGIEDPAAGYLRPLRTPGGKQQREAEAGLGLWAARQLCHVLDYGHDDDGFTVRLVSYRS